MARVTATAATHQGIKANPSFWQCRRCATDNIVLDELKKHGQDVFHGFSGPLPLDCHACGEMYSITLTIA